MIRTLIGSVAAVAAIVAGGVPVLAGGRGSAASRPTLRQPDPSYTGGSARPGTDLTLAYMAEAGYAAAVRLTCQPPGGGHPEAARACATLADTGADPTKITPSPQVCLLVYAPITAEITGTWRGAPVSWRQTYGNSCEMRRATGVLFRF